MAGELRQYIPIKVVGSWATPTNLGVIDILDGVIDGEFVTETSDNPRWVREHDRQGNATRVRNNNRGGSFSVTISASSPTNTRLSLAVQEDDVSEACVGPLVLKDLNGNTVLEADGAFLADMATVTFGAERGSRVWIFECAAKRSFVGGHDKA